MAHGWILRGTEAVSLISILQANTSDGIKPITSNAHTQTQDGGVCALDGVKYVGYKRRHGQGDPRSRMCDKWVMSTLYLELICDTCDNL